MGLLSKANKYSFNTDCNKAKKYSFNTNCSVVDRIENNDRYKRIILKDKRFDDNFYNNSNFVKNLYNWKRDNPKNKIVGVLFSNGLDSTYKVIEEILKGNCVVPIINTFNDDYDIFNVSCYAIEILSRLYPGQLFKPLPIINISFNEYVNFGDSFKFTQQFMNPYSVSLIDREILKYIEEVHYGLVLEDQGVSFLNEIKTVYKLGFEFNCDYINSKIKIPILKFDLIKKLKSHLYEEFDHIVFRKLPIISCENPDITYYINEDKSELIIGVRICNNCHSCITNNNMRIPLSDNFIIKVNIKDRLFRWDYYNKDDKLITAEAKERCY